MLKLSAISSRPIGLTIPSDVPFLCDALCGVTCDEDIVLFVT
jgi:hypothetical protein